MRRYAVDVHPLAISTDRWVVVGQGPVLEANDTGIWIGRVQRLKPLGAVVHVAGAGKVGRHAHVTPLLVDGEVVGAAHGPLMKWRVTERCVGQADRNRRPAQWIG